MTPDSPWATEDVHSLIWKYIWNWRSTVFITFFWIENTIKDNRLNTSFITYKNITMLFNMVHTGALFYVYMYVPHFVDSTIYFMQFCKKIRIWLKCPPLKIPKEVWQYVKLVLENCFKLSNIYVLHRWRTPLSWFSLFCAWPHWLGWVPAPSVGPVW